MRGCLLSRRIGELARAPIYMAPARFHRIRHIRGGRIEWPARASLGRGRLQFPKCRHRPFSRRASRGVLAVASTLARKSSGLGPLTFISSPVVFPNAASRQFVAQPRDSQPLATADNGGAPPHSCGIKTDFASHRDRTPSGNASTEMFGFRPGSTPPGVVRR
jgi:hypothetical protein